MPLTLAQLRGGGVDAADTAAQLVEAHGIGMVEGALAQNGAAFEAWVNAEVKDALERLDDATGAADAWDVEGDDADPASDVLSLPPPTCAVSFAHIVRECCDRAMCLVTPERRAALLHNGTLFALATAFCDRLKRRADTSHAFTPTAAPPDDDTRARVRVVLGAARHAEATLMELAYSAPAFAEETDPAPATFAVEFATLFQDWVHIL